MACCDDEDMDDDCLFVLRLRFEVLAPLPPPMPPLAEHKSSVELPPDDPDDDESIDELDNSDMLEGLDGDNKLIMFMQFELGTCCNMAALLTKPLLC